MFKTQTMLAFAGLALALGGCGEPANSDSSEEPSAASDAYTSDEAVGALGSESPAGGATAGATTSATESGSRPTESPATEAANERSRGPSARSSTGAPQ